MQATFNDYKSSSEILGAETLAELFSQLPSVSNEEVLGIWTGGCFNAGHPGEAMLTALSWRGKRFASTEDVNPLLVTGEGDALAVNDSMGAARLRQVEHAGTVSAAMIYDTQAIMDYFRKVDDNTLMGVMDSKGHPPMYFWLERSNASVAD